MDNPRQHWSGGDWFALPAAWLDGEALSALTLAELLTLLKLARHAGFESGETRPGTDRIGAVVSKASGEKSRRRTAERALSTLQANGLATLIEQGGGRELANVFRLNVINPDAHTEVSATQTPTAGAQKPRSVAYQTPTARTRNPDAHTGPTHRTQRTKPMNKAPAKTGGCDGALRPCGGDGLGHVETADLTDGERLIALYCRWHGCERPEYPTPDWLNFAGAAIHAMNVRPRNGQPIRNRAALFAAMIRKGDYSKVSNADEDAARAMLIPPRKPAPRPQSAERVKQTGDAMADRLAQVKANGRHQSDHSEATTIGDLAPSTAGGNGRAEGGQP